MVAMWIIMIAVIGMMLAVLIALASMRGTRRRHSWRGMDAWTRRDDDYLDEEYEESYIGAPRPWQEPPFAPRLAIKLGLLLALGLGILAFAFFPVMRSGIGMATVEMPVIFLALIFVFALVGAASRAHSREQRRRDKQVRLIRKRRKPRLEESPWDDSGDDEYVYLDELRAPETDDDADSGVPLEALLNPPDDDETHA
ncbi:MAG: hypothetical protein JW910_18075 [Anaerolineae bacterium]|nr:hypothetical protein [Anaerolineae bacterium]